MANFLMGSSLVVMGGLLGLIIIFFGRWWLRNWRTAIRPIAAVCAVIVPFVFMYLQPWPPGDIYGWGFHAVPPILAGALAAFAWHAGRRLSLLLVLVWQVLISGFSLDGFINAMDGYGYNLSYLVSQNRFHGEEVYSQVQYWWDKEIFTLILYLVVITVLLTAPLVLLHYLNDEDAPVNVLIGNH